jgi:hypothetical protein
MEYCGLKTANWQHFLNASTLREPSVSMENIFFYLRAAILGQFSPFKMFALSAYGVFGK